MAEIELIERQLDRTLNFFGRVDTKSSLVLGLNLGILAVALSNVDYLDFATWYIAIPLIVALILVAFSVADIFLSAIPDLKGGEGSCFYFRSISERTESGYIDEFQSLNTSQIERQLLAQIWRNSQILKDKFLRVERAFKITLVSILPWTLFLVLSAIHHARMIEV